MPLAAFAAGLLQDGAYYLFALKPKCVKYFKYHKISRTARTDLTLTQYRSSGVSRFSVLQRPRRTLPDSGDLKVWGER